MNMLKSPLIRYQGRVLEAPDTQDVFMDWSLTGFIIEFEGTRLTASFSANAGIEPSGRFGAGTAEPREIWPFIGVLVDDSEEFAQRIRIDDVQKEVVLFESEDAQAGPQRHKIQVVKLTENLKSGLRFHGLDCDGTFLPLSDEPKPVMEIIGDSITCGFGNEADTPLKGFFSEDENGWLAYGALTARKLGMQPQIVASSGICLAMKEWTARPYGIADLYEYTDRPREDRIWSICPDSNMTLVPEGLPETNAQKWDFASHPVDTVLINLGTNDADGCNYGPDPDERADRFEDDYLNFLHKVRALNGPDTKIVCALGDMRYYLWDRISSAVARYVEETDDDKIRLIKLHGIKPTERRGAGDHPSVDTDQRMSEQLVEFLKD